MKVSLAVVALAAITGVCADQIFSDSFSDGEF